jgi:diguanylate cyclase (GGDEF)-like protein
VPQPQKSIVERSEILVADDSAVFRKLVQQTLTEDRYALVFAKSGHEAIQLFESRRPSVVIVDWVMPDLTGIEICQHIRAKVQSSYTYTIILTGMAEKENVVAGLAAGADDYLTKPFHAEELIARVGVGIRIIELQRQIEAKNRQLEQLALTDALTGLPNRRAIDDWATREVSSAARHKFSFWVAVADLDNFKSANDTHGHQAGDEVLKKFSEILKANSRRSDICGRLGGEEFLIVLTHAAQADVRMVVERIRKEFEAIEFVFQGRRLRVTASFGIAGFEGRQALDFSALVAQADSALYSAKRLGRNRVEMAQPAKAT